MRPGLIGFEYYLNKFLLEFYTFAYKSICEAHGVDYRGVQEADKLKTEKAKSDDEGVRCKSNKTI